MMRRLRREGWKAPAERGGAVLQQLERSLLPRMIASIQNLNTLAYTRIATRLLRRQVLAPW